MLRTVVEIGVAYWPCGHNVTTGLPRLSWAYPWGGEVELPKHPYDTFVVPEPLQAGAYNLRWSRCPNSDDPINKRRRSQRWACEAMSEYDIRDGLPQFAEEHYPWEE